MDVAIIQLQRLNTSACIAAVYSYDYQYILFVMPTLVSGSVISALNPYFQFWYCYYNATVQSEISSWHLLHWICL